MNNLIALIGIGLLLVVGARGSSEEDVRCIVYSDGCGSCLKSGCSWCADGFCIGKGSDICPAQHHLDSCAAVKSEPIDIEALHKRSSGPSCTASDCNSCSVTDCTYCYNPSTLYGFCQPNTVVGCSQEPYIYGTSYTVVPSVNLNLTSTSDRSNGTCVLRPIATAGAILPIITFSYVVPTGANLQVLADTIMTIIATDYPQLGYTFNLDNVIYLLFNVLSKRDNFITTAVSLVDNGNLTTRTNNGKILQNWANSANGNPTLFTTVSEIQYSQGYIDANGNLVEVTPQVTAATNQTVSPTSNKGHGSDKILSRGALAGIIIGVIVGTAIICLIIFFLILRRRETYPLPFRSPAAAYRP